MAAVDAALAEVNATLAALAAPHEGLRDYARLNLLPETQIDVRAMLDKFDRRVARLTAVKLALEVLILEGDPAIGTREIADNVLRDLQGNERSISAALLLFAGAEQAAALGLAAGPVVQKE